MGYFDDINFDELPNEFILKLTNGSSFNYICTNKNQKEIKKMRRRFKMWLKVDYYKYGKEWTYKGVKNRIICEELLKLSSWNPREDYGFFCFEGKIYFGEITFYHSSGYQNFEPYFFEVMLGEFLSCLTIRSCSEECN